MKSVISMQLITFEKGGFFLSESTKISEITIFFSTLFQNLKIWVIDLKNVFKKYWHYILYPTLSCIAALRASILISKLIISHTNSAFFKIDRSALAMTVWWLNCRLITKKDNFHSVINWSRLQLSQSSVFFVVNFSLLPMEWGKKNPGDSNKKINNNVVPLSTLVIYESMIKVEEEVEGGSRKQKMGGKWEKKLEKKIKSIEWY